MKPSRVNLWAVAVLWVCVTCFSLGFYLMVRNESSPLFLLPSIAMGAVAIINLREK